MTSRDEGVRRWLVAGMASADREYNASSGEAPIELLAPLFALIFTFGVFLTVFVPFAYVTEAAAELEHGEILRTLWFVGLAGLSLFVLLRWCAVQTMAFIVHCINRSRCKSDNRHLYPIKRWFQFPRLKPRQRLFLFFHLRVPRPAISPSGLARFW